MIILLDRQQGEENRLVVIVDYDSAFDKHPDIIQLSCRLFALILKYSGEDRVITKLKS